MKKYFLWIAASILLLHLEACHQKCIEPRPDCRTEFSLKEGDTFTSPEGLRIAATQLTDSRCPANAVCIWLGNAQVAVRISLGSEVVERRLCIGDCNGTATAPQTPRNTDAATFSIGGRSYTLNLLEIAPYPGTPSGTQERSAKLVIDGCSQL